MYMKVILRKIQGYMRKQAESGVMESSPTDALLYLSTLVTVFVDGVWMSGFDFCASRGVQIHVITAWNPGDARPSFEINEARNEQLRAEI